MKDTPINYEVVSRKIKESRIENIGRASIRELKKLIDEISHSGRNIILFIDEIHNLMVMENSSENLSIGDILKPAMARGSVRWWPSSAVSKGSVDRRWRVSSKTSLAFRSQPVQSKR
mgnify:CR=1 FL=1